MSRREAWLSAAVVFAVAVAVRAWAASQIVFPRPEDAAYYVGVARNLVEGRGIVSDAIWSFQTPPLEFPRPAFEVWLPLPTVLMAGSMALLGDSLFVAQVPSILLGGVLAALAWRLAGDVAAERELLIGRSRTIALGTGLTVGVYLPLVLASAEPDSTTPFAALALAACLLMARLRAAPGTGGLLGLGVLLGLAALTRNEAIWLALTWAIVAWRVASSRPAWLRLVGIPAAVALAAFAPWAIRDWLTFGTPLPGQGLANALSLNGTDIFAWWHPPTLERYLGPGIAFLAGLRVKAAGHNLIEVLLLLGIPVSAIGLVALPWTARGRTLLPLLVFSLLTFAITTLLFPVATIWGTFLHAAGAIAVLLILSAVLALDALIAAVGRRLGWTNPVAWLGPALTISGSILFTVVLLPAEAGSARDTQARYQTLVRALSEAGAPLDTLQGPVITDFPIWFAESTGHEALALPNEEPAAVLDLADHFGARLLVVQADNGGIWPEAIGLDPATSSCFTPLPLTHLGDDPDPLEGVTVFRIECP